MDWRDITDEKEKYQAYLCSREWAEKREAVRKRAYDTCERCESFPMDACHHLTYERKYCEKLEDLQATCNFCHEFTHGKSNFDPLSCGRFIRYVKEVAAEGLKSPVNFEFLEGLDFDVRSNAAVSAIYLLFEQYRIANAIQYGFDCAYGEKYDEAAEKSLVEEWLEIARLVQKEKLSVDLVRWLEMSQPDCKTVADYTTILVRFGFPNPYKE